ncbi:lysozyme C-like [Betta splendens]|uniref:lysozyme n=1 Tax=Betta splendens TaxID=158456 RepID=A0A6P7P0P7_BETSP|nr:lysozyme C-like [Betta splendens]
MRCLALLLLVAVASAKVVERCEWAQILREHGMDGYYGYSLANWFYLSFNTKAINYNTDGSADYGVFLINSHWWCTDGSPTSNDCGISCGGQ